MQPQEVLPAHEPTVATPPDWIAEAWRVTVADVRAFLQSSVALLRRPRQFAARWATGQSRALNPLAFMATSAAVLGVAQALIGLGSGNTLAAAALAVAAPYAHFGWLGLLAHAALRLLGSRQKLRVSLGVALYVGGAPALAFTLVLYGVSVAMYFATHVDTFEAAIKHLPFAARLLVALIFDSGFLAVLTYLGAALAGAHGARVWQAVLAILVALVISGAIYGFWRPPPTVGAHFVLWLRSDEMVRAPTFSIRF
jgi:hypothetical protein